jgi:hypothetical protein
MYTFHQQRKRCKLYVEKYMKGGEERPQKSQRQQLGNMDTSSSCSSGRWFLVLPPCLPVAILVASHHPVCPCSLLPASNTSSLLHLNFKFTKSITVLINIWSTRNQFDNCTCRYHHTRSSEKMFTITCMMIWQTENMVAKTIKWNEDHWACKRIPSCTKNTL